MLHMYSMYMQMYSSVFSYENDKLLLSSVIWGYMYSIYFIWLIHLSIFHSNDNTVRYLQYHKTNSHKLFNTVHCSDNTKLINICLNSFHKIKFVGLSGYKLLDIIIWIRVIDLDKTYIDNDIF